jgi:hypothetical protein
LQRAVKAEEKDLNEEALAAPLSEAIAEAASRNDAKPGLVVLRAVMSELNLPVPKRLETRLEPVSDANIEVLNAASKALADANVALSYAIAAKESDARAILADVGQRLRPDERADDIMAKIAIMYMCSPRAAEDVRRGFGVILRDAMNREQLMHRAHDDALNDPNFFPAFCQQFYDEVRAEHSRGSRKGRREARPERLQLDWWGASELRRRRDFVLSTNSTGKIEEDFAAFLSGHGFAEEFNKCRVPEEAFMIALKFIAQLCREQWRPGKTQTVEIGKSVMSSVPFMQRHDTAENMYLAYEAEYMRLGGKIGGLKPLGRDAFVKLVMSVTKEVEEKACLSYYFTDFLAAGELLGAICDRLDTLMHLLDVANLPVQWTAELKAQNLSVDDLKTFTAEALAFGKYELYKHVETSPENCTGCSIHCGAHAVGAPCSQEHRPSCEQCMAFRSVPRVINTFRNSLWCAVSRKLEHDPSSKFGHADIGPDPLAELDSMHGALVYIDRCFNSFMQHVMRGEWQSAYIDEVIDTVSERFVLVHFDHRMKQTLRKLNESTEEHFGQSGESVLGVCVHYRAEKDGPIQSQYVDYVVDDNRQSAVQVQSILDCFMREDLVRIAPRAEEVAFLSDNGAAFGTFDHLPWIVERNSKNWYRGDTTVGDGVDYSNHPQVRVVRFLFFEAQRGKGLVDCHFAFLAKQVKLAVKRGITVGTPDSIFFAFTLNGGVSNTSTVRLDLDVAEDKDQVTFKPPSKATQLGIRRVHDIKIDANSCIVFMQINSDYRVTIDVSGQASTKVPKPNYFFKQRSVPTRIALVRRGSRTGAGGVAISEGWEMERPFSQSMMTAIASFAQGKGVAPRMSLRAGLVDSKALNVQGASVAEGEAVAVAKGSKKKKVGLVSVPQAEDIARFESAWTWKETRSRPAMSEAKKARVREMVCLVLERHGQALTCNCTSNQYESKEKGEKRYNAQRIAETLIIESRFNWTDRAACSVDAVKSIISGLTSGKKARNVKQARAAQARPGTLSGPQSNAAATMTTTTTTTTTTTATADPQTSADDDSDSDIEVVDEPIAFLHGPTGGLADTFADAEDACDSDEGQ